MKYIITTYLKYKEVINYLIAGAATTAINLAVYYVAVIFFLDAGSAIQLQIANIISWIIAVIFAYVVNRRFVFESTNPDRLREAASFFGARLLTLLIDMASMFLLVTLWRMNDKVAKIIVQFIVIVANYVLSKFLVFKRNFGNE